MDEPTQIKDVLKKTVENMSSPSVPLPSLNSDAHWYENNDAIQKLKANEYWHLSKVPKLHSNAPLRTELEWAKVMEHCRSTVTRKEKRGSIIALIGNRGTGKTQIGVESIRHACLALYTCAYRRAFDIFLATRAAMKSQHTNESEVMRELLDVGLLVIDEMQERGETPFEDRLLVYLLDKRYGNMTDTILIANQTPGEFTAALGPSITDRIRESGGIIECAWESFRK